MLSKQAIKQALLNFEFLLLTYFSITLATKK